MATPIEGSYRGITDTLLYFNTAFDFELVLGGTRFNLDFDMTPIKKVEELHKQIDQAILANKPIDFEDVAVQLQCNDQTESTFEFESERSNQQEQGIYVRVNEDAVIYLYPHDLENPKEVDTELYNVSKGVRLYTIKDLPPLEFLATDEALAKIKKALEAKEVLVTAEPQTSYVVYHLLSDEDF